MPLFVDLKNAYFFRCCLKLCAELHARTSGGVVSKLMILQPEVIQPFIVNSNYDRCES